MKKHILTLAAFFAVSLCAHLVLAADAPSPQVAVVTTHYALKNIAPEGDGKVPSVVDDVRKIVLTGGNPGAQGNSKVTYSAATNELIVAADAEHQGWVAGYLANVDRPVPIFEVKVRMEEWAAGAKSGLPEQMAAAVTKSGGTVRLRQIAGSSAVGIVVTPRKLGDRCNLVGYEISIDGPGGTTLFSTTARWRDGEPIEVALPCADGASQQRLSISVKETPPKTAA